MIHSTLIYDCTKVFTSVHQSYSFMSWTTVSAGTSCACVNAITSEVTIVFYRWIEICMLVIFRLVLLDRIAHTTYVDAVCCYQPSSMVCLSVCHTTEPCKNGWTDRDAVWVGDSGGLREPYGGPDPAIGMGNFEGRKRRPIVKYRDTLRSSVQKRLNQLRCRLGYGIEWAQ